MPVQHESTTPAELAACRASSPCPACRKRGGEALVAGTIHGYGSEPRGGWVVRRNADEPLSGVPTFGVELETQRLPDYDRTALTGAEAANVAQPRGHWFPTADGSVDGPEFASQPATLAYWRSIAGPVGSFMRTLIHGGLRAHDGRQSCSMHVNIGADTFATDEHLARFIRLATMNPKFTTRMAQRTHSQVSQWARYDTYPDMAACRRHAHTFRYEGTSYTGHGAAVNLENHGRVEFRSPRGTLRLDRFMAKLEWVAAMVEYTRADLARVSIGGFVAWVMERRSEYPEFVTMMSDLTPARVAGAPRTPRVPRTPVVPVVSTCAAGYTAHAPGCSCTAPGDMLVCEARNPVSGEPCVGRRGHRLSTHRDGYGDTWVAPVMSPDALMTDDEGVLHDRDSAERTWLDLVTYPDRDTANCTRCGLSWGRHSGMLCNNQPRRDINGDRINSVWSTR